MTEKEQAVELLIMAVRDQLGGAVFEAVNYGWKDDNRDGDARWTVSIPIEQRDYAKNVVTWPQANLIVVVIKKPDPDLP